MKRAAALTTAAAGAFFGISPLAFADDLFRVTATDTGAAPIAPVTISGNKIIDIVESAVKTNNGLDAFSSRDTRLSLQYGDVTDAIVLTKNASNTQATLTFPGTNIPTRTFTGANEDDLKDQITDYLKKNGSSDVKEFLKAINARSAIAVSDGNPAATTARFAQFAYDQFGMHDSISRPPVSESGDREKGRYEVRVDANGGVYDAGDFSGAQASVLVSSRYDWTERFGTSLGLFASYSSLEDADVFNAGVQLGLPIRIVLATSSQHWGWQLTPHAVIGGGGSEELGAGGLIYGGGLTSLLTLDRGKWTFALVDQVTYYHGQKLSFGDFDLDPGVDQTMLKNGLKAEYRFAGTWYAYGAASLTNFLDDAAVQSYVTPEIGLGWKRAGGTGLEIGYAGDFGSDFNGHQIKLGLNIAF